MELPVGGDTSGSRWHSSSGTAAVVSAARVPGRIRAAMKNGKQIRHRRETHTLSVGNTHIINIPCDRMLQLAACRVNK